MERRRAGAARAALGIVAVLTAASPGLLRAEQQVVIQGLDQEAINKAVEKGARYLIAQAQAAVPLPHYGAGHLKGQDTVDELALYALLHADVDRHHPEVTKLLNAITGRAMDKTYPTAIRAQALHKYDPRMLANHIRNAAQYLIDNQSQRGYWGYGDPITLPELPKIVVTPSPQRVYTGIKGGDTKEARNLFGDGPCASPWVPPSAGPSTGISTGRSGGNTTVRGGARNTLKRNGWGKDHDNSNTQYALLGLYACMAAGFYPPQDLLDLAEKWLTDTQCQDGGWSYESRGGSYGSMTAGGVSSLCIVLRGKNVTEPHKDARVEKALQWLGLNMNFAGNPNKGNQWHYYWIYSVERAGSAANVEFFGNRNWYKEGATYLLACQNGDGSWGGENGAKKICDTAWAILFLRRATKGITNKIVYSGTASEGKTETRVK